jgi:hypothetical protein
MLGQEDSAVTSMIKTASKENSILGTLAGSPFDPSPPTINIDAAEQAIAGLGGGFLSQLQAAAQSAARLSLGGLTDPLTASRSELSSVITNALSNSGISIPAGALAAALPITLIDQIRTGQASLDQVAGTIASQLENLESLSPADLEAGLAGADLFGPVADAFDVGPAFAAPLDPTQTLTNFNNQS